MAILVRKVPISWRFYALAPVYNTYSAMYLKEIKSLSSRSSRLRQNQTMSKAFTKETDADHDEAPALLALPAGSKNYITPHG